jgi:hypothetical protein
MCAIAYSTLSERFLKRSLDIQTFIALAAPSTNDLGIITPFLVNLTLRVTSLPHRTLITSSVS